MKITLTGKLRPGISTKDITLHIIGTIKADGALYKSVEFHGEPFEDFSFDSRFIFSNMSVEMGAKNGYIPPNQKVLDYAKARAKQPFEPIYPDPDAQYALGKLLLDGTSGVKDPKQALRWLNLAANKGQARAQALLGSVMFKGEVVPRQAARGLMWLTLALDGAGGEKWAVDMHAAASKQATDAERQMAVLYLERYMMGRRD